MTLAVGDIGENQRRSYPHQKQIKIIPQDSSAKLMRSFSRRSGIRMTGNLRVFGGRHDFFDYMYGCFRLYRGEVKMIGKLTEFFI
jgi:hypothetical protein